MRITKRKLSGITLDPDNARKHGELDIKAIAASLTEFGQVTPVVVTAQGVVVKGNGTVMAAMSLGWTEVTAITTQLTGDQLKAYAIADNQTGLIAKWDDRRLAEQIETMEEQLRESLSLRVPESQVVKPPKITAAKPKVTFSIRVEDVSQEDKDKVIELLAQVLAEGDYAYSAAAY